MLRQMRYFARLFPFALLALASLGLSSCTGSEELPMWSDWSQTRVEGPTLRVLEHVSGEEPHRDGFVSVTLPQGATNLLSGATLEQEGSVQVRAENGNDWGRFYDEPPTVSPDGLVITVRYKNWKREGKTIGMRVQYLPAGSEKTMLRSWVDWFENQPVFAVLMLLVSVVVGGAALLGAVVKLRRRGSSAEGAD